MDSLASLDSRDFLRRLSQARRQPRPAHRSVLDVLGAEVPDLTVLTEALHRWAGVRVVRPDELAMEPPLAQAAWPFSRSAPARLSSGEQVLAMNDPWDLEEQSAALACLGLTLPGVAVTGAVLGQLLQLQEPPTDAEPALPSNASADGDGDSPVVSFVDHAIRSAYAAGASDIHFECDRKGVSAKLRQDGVMTPHSRLTDAKQAGEVINRIKVMAQLDITESRKPQDGRIRFDLGTDSLDLRVSVMPSILGEDAVLRLLDKAQLKSEDNQVTLDLLGFDTSSSKALRELGELPHGMLLVTGPTGSGKTTTVYAILSEVNTGLEKIITIEDPVEYELPGVLQIPVNEQKGLTFAVGLRSILRHDPDRILVGEIRDAETAEIAVQSALTGHQVFTTVHANSIFDVTGRFRHFGLDMFGFMAALNGVVVQRLIRRLCPHCAGARSPDEREKHWLQQMGVTLSVIPKEVGCSQCSGTGYRGRLVIAEVHRVDDRFRDLVTAGASVTELRRHVAAQAVATLGVQGARLVANGVTTPQEIKRVVGWI